MNPNKIIAALAVAAIGAVAVKALIPDTKDVPTPVNVKKENTFDEKLAALPDGGVGYVRDVELTDGGHALKVVVGAPGCVRRPKVLPAAACRRRFVDGGITDPGPLNRFPAAEAQGAQCQPVACSVFLGEDPDAEEVDRIKARPVKP